MKTILVKAVAARESGAMTILKEFLRSSATARENRYVFLTGSVPENKQIQCIPVPAAQRGMLHRLWFDLFGIRKILKAVRPDEILSLDNLTVPFTRIPQTLYLQCVIPFFRDKWRLSESPRLWLYRYPMKPLIIHSVRKARKVIVQTEWMKGLCAAACRTDESRFLVRPPYAGVREQNLWQGTARFFYPATAYPYKNHAVLFRALKALGKCAPEIRLTLTEEALSAFGAAYGDVKTHVTALGVLNTEAMRREYLSSVLVFPSRMESYGLPLKEARLLGAPILAADTPFAREVLSGYERARFFPPEDENALANLMISFRKEHAHASGDPANPQKA